MKDSTKFLGVMLDKYLDFDEHVQYTKGKVSRGLGILKRCCRVFIQKTLITLYYSFLYPYLNFCNSVWGNTNDKILKPLDSCLLLGIFLFLNKIFLAGRDSEQAWYRGGGGAQQTRDWQDLDSGGGRCSGGSGR